MEIIGNGMIAKGLLRYSADVNDAVVFASGVSDSTLKDQKEYERECRILDQVIRDCKKRDKTLVYFSSGGTVYGKSNDERKEDAPLFPETMYGRHKVLCESVIISSGVRYLVVRLPTVVGQTKSEKQLIPVLIKQAMEGHVTLLKDAERDIIGIADVAGIITAILKKLKRDEIINVASGVSVSVSDILSEIQNNLGVKPIIKIVSGGDKQKFNVDKLHAYCPEITFTMDYYRDVIREYISEQRDVRV
jgi:nucleoside-diphosphate-sugar epimerase